ncbi:MAG: type II toxin-antitoxin system RelE/ParE family toxin [Pseudomonadota bacterium]
MKRDRVIITPFAADNIREAYAWYLAENPTHAVKWLEGIEAAILGLETLPEAHGLAPESRAFGRDIRQLLYGSSRRWRVFFVVEEMTVHVLHVRHGSRDYWLP